MFNFVKKYDKKVVSICTLAFGAIFLFVSFLVPPMGIIDDSVLQGVGILLLYASTIDGLDALRSKLGNRGNEIEN